LCEAAPGDEITLRFRGKRAKSDLQRESGREWEVDDSQKKWGRINQPVQEKEAARKDQRKNRLYA